MMPFSNAWYKLGRADAKDNRYPLYSVLVAAERWADAREYACGYKAITKCHLPDWWDRSSEAA